MPNNFRCADRRLHSPKFFNDAKTELEEAFYH